MKGLRYKGVEDIEHFSVWFVNGKDKLLLMQAILELKNYFDEYYEQIFFSNNHLKQFWQRQEHSIIIKLPHWFLLSLTIYSNKNGDNFKQWQIQE